MFNAIIQWVLGVTAGLGYTGITALMAIESSVLPLPSEIIIPPAAWLASQGRMSLGFLILAGTFGSVLGASVNYWLSRWLGRPVVYQLAKNKIVRALGVTPEGLEKAEKLFIKDAKRSTFIGRLIPVIRHLISVPAGFCQMNYGSFVLFTALGSLLWVSILAGLGYFLGANQVLLERYYQEITWALLVLGVIWLAWKFRKRLFGK